ncbi:MAG: GatB/YqeY domain-containing protein [Atopobium sp.]|uniref:GatB/YqeY domain-containing protein n=1 Tax=Atopobium sp. TaxID=1872650 RepID=UPI002A76321D|nr:GatB/YqeY domain-containing protein [Atopobium sp.]MDY2787805.1 GatB/YqeY domain-containing protein [Atopobium sp.]
MQKAELLELIKQAMKAQDKTRLSILRQINQAIKQIEVDERRDVTETDIVACIKKLQKVTNEELEALRGANTSSHTDRIESLATQADILSSLLPRQLAGSELEALADELIASLGVSTKRDMGKVMGALTKQTNGNFDKPAAAAYIGSKLA